MIKIKIDCNNFVENKINLSFKSFHEYFVLCLANGAFSMHSSLIIFQEIKIGTFLSLYIYIYI